jgi:hypothetical protein
MTATPRLALMRAYVSAIDKARADRAPEAVIRGLRALRYGPTVVNLYPLEVRDLMRKEPKKAKAMCTPFVSVFRAHVAFLKSVYSNHRLLPRGNPAPHPVALPA